ncbi:colicin-like pore-forming protein [Klebsiella aerogenes]|uniref:colicin-like pore-forming protein n=1 Tax=Klebsiella aerogenes TaxID=548 RepID=UPI000CDE483B|nr:colicin-like pore-forming protein [Klebsiella aerogenes]EKU7555385.1 hypothetical protein [Klebsiella aerogenes]POU57938.1 hypothetical protein C3384_12860 [Klebsiella aerogenes]
MANEDSMTVNGNAGSGVHWGGGSGNGNGGGAGNTDGVRRDGPVVTYDADGSIRINIYGADPINPVTSGAPWGDDKNAASIINANRNKPAKYKANIKNWHEGYVKTGSMDSPAVNILNDSGDKQFFQVSFGKEKYNVIYDSKKDSFTTGYVDGGATKKEQLMDDQALAVVKLYLLNKKEKDLIETTLGIIIDTGKTLSGKMGDKYHALAQGVANDIRNFQGKKIRSFKDAMASLEAFTKNPNMKLNQADKAALVNALNHVNLSTLADRFKGLERTFTWADRVTKAQKIKDGVVTGVTTGNWQSLAFEVEAMYLSGIAGSVALGIVTAMISGLAALVSIPAVAVTALTVTAVIGIAIATSYINADTAKALNNAVADLFK